MRRIEMGSHDEGYFMPECKRRPLYTVRQPPLIQPLRLSAFTQKTCARYGASLEDLAHEWVVLFEAISGGKMGDAMPLRIPDTVLLSPSGQPSVWYTTSSSGRVKAKDLMRVSPQAILTAFQTYQKHSSSDIIAVRRMGFEVDSLCERQLRLFCRDMERPSICFPLEPSFPIASSSNNVLSGLTKGVFCLQRYIPRQNDSSFLIVWRHLSVLPNSERADSDHCCNVDASRITNSIGRRSTRRAHSDVFLMTQPKMECERDVVEDGAESSQKLVQNAHLSYLEISRPDEKTFKTLRQSGFDPDVMAPLLFYMKRMTSEIANSINLGHNAQQACGLACQFFVGEHNRSVYFSSLCGIQWIACAPSWERLREVDALSRSLCEFYDTHTSSNRRWGPPTSREPRSPVANERTMYEQNPRFPSVQTPFTVEKQWLHRSQLLAPDISPRYVGVSVPKIYRDGVFQSLLTAHQADSVVRLNRSPQIPASLAEVRREQSHLSPRSVSFQRRTAKKASSTPKEDM